MSTNTKNLKLIQQESNEYYDLNIINKNLEIIDDEIGERSDSPNLLNSNVTSFEIGKGTVEGEIKDYTNQMQQSIVTLNNIIGKTVKDGTILKSIKLNIRNGDYVKNTDINLCSLPNGLYDELVDCVLTKKVDYINTSKEGGYTPFEFSTTTNGSDSYGRLTVDLENANITNVNDILCNVVEIVDYNITPNEWNTPTKNSLMINVSPTNKARIAFILKGVASMESALNAIRNTNPRQFVYKVQSPKSTNINISILANRGDTLSFDSPLSITCTHKVQLNTKAQVEELQDFIIKENKSVWEKIKRSTDIRSNLATNGYKIFPGGLILQWGVVTFTTQNNEGLFDAKVTFPILFPNKCLICTPTLDVIDSNGWGEVDNYIAHAYSLSGSSCNVRGKSIKTTTMNKSGFFRYIAIGY